MKRRQYRTLELDKDMTTRQGPLWDFLEGRTTGPPSSRHLGFRCREIDPEAGTITAEFQASQEFLNPGGNVQGGFLAAMLDETMAPLIHATLGPGFFAPTLELKVSFIRPASPGLLVARGRIVHRGRSVAFLEGELRDPDDTLIATATATVRIVAAKGKLDLG